MLQLIAAILPPSDGTVSLWPPRQKKRTGRSGRRTTPIVRASPLMSRGKEHIVLPFCFKVKQYPQLLCVIGPVQLYRIRRIS